ncbi:hypothetical protein V1477_011440 [Vespula maculifrons]|uniref:Uncharacterized protein n=1 Tax=Vespula maculifrons TaxID=7453 RepID=A0ABD2BZ83_VESMC
MRKILQFPLQISRVSLTGKNCVEFGNSIDYICLSRPWLTEKSSGNNMISRISLTGKNRVKFRMIVNSELKIKKIFSLHSK